MEVVLGKYIYKTTTIHLLTDFFFISPVPTKLKLMECGVLKDTNNKKMKQNNSYNKA